MSCVTIEKILQCPHRIDFHISKLPHMLSHHTLTMETFESSRYSERLDISELLSELLHSFAAITIFPRGEPVFSVWVL